MGAAFPYDGASTSRLMNDWNVVDTDVNDDWWRSAIRLRARTWDLYQNNPLAAALVETVVAGTFGPTGLIHQSLYQEDDDTDTSDAEQEIRRQINKYVGRACLGTRLDASGMMSHRDLSVALEISKLVAGDGFAIRLWLPSRRPDAVTGTCWRLIDPARVSNPFDGANSATMFEGIELDGSGSPIAIHIRSAHPRLQRMSTGKITWTRVPFFDENGDRLVIHRRSAKRPDQVRGISALATSLTDLHHLSELKNAWIVAKRMNATVAWVVKTKDPVKAAAADRNGALLAGTVGMKPAMKYYVGLDDTVEMQSTDFQGGSFDELTVTLAQSVAAAWCLPVEMVLRRLTKTNMASSRAALLDYYMTVQREQDEHILQVEQPIVESLIREGIVRGEIDVGADVDWDMTCAGMFRRPPRVFPDPLKEAQAAQAKAELGYSYTTIYAEAGHSFEDEIARRKQDNDYLEAQGVSLGSNMPTTQDPADVRQQEADAAQAQADVAAGDAQPQDKTNE